MERRGWGKQRDPEQQRWALPLLATLKCSPCEAMGSIHRLDLRQLQREHQGPQVCPQVVKTEGLCSRGNEVSPKAIYLDNDLKQNGHKHSEGQQSCVTILGKSKSAGSREAKFSTRS